MSDKHTQPAARPSRKPFLLAALLAVSGVGMLSLLVGGCLAAVFWLWPETEFELSRQGAWQTVNADLMRFESLRDFRRAETILRKVVSLPHAKENPVPHYLLARIYQMTGRQLEARQALARVIRIADASDIGRLRYRIFLNKAYGEAALIDYEFHHPASAIRALRAISDLDDTNSPDLLSSLNNVLDEPGRADFHYELGKSYYYNHNSIMAARELRQALGSDLNAKTRLQAQSFYRRRLAHQNSRKPSLATYYLQAGDYYQDELEDAGTAVHFYELARAAIPSNADVYANLGLAYRAVNELDKAERNLVTALALGSDVMDAQLTLGDIALDRHDYQEAIRIYTQARSMIQRAPENYGDNLAANIENQLGYAYESLRKRESALSHYRRALALASEDLEENGDYDFAESAILRVLKEK